MFKCSVDAEIFTLMTRFNCKAWVEWNALSVPGHGRKQTTKFSGWDALTAVEA